MSREARKITRAEVERFVQSQQSKRDRQNLDRFLDRCKRDNGLRAAFRERFNSPSR